MPSEVDAVTAINGQARSSPNPCDIPGCPCLAGAEPDENCGHHECRMYRIPAVCTDCGNNTWWDFNFTRYWCYRCHIEVKGVMSQ